MKKILSLIICLCCLCACSNGTPKKETETTKITETQAATEKQTEQQTVAQTEEVSDKSIYIEHVKNEVVKSGLLLTYPDDEEWSIMPYDGYMTASCTARKEGEKCIVTAWISMDNETIHYLDTKYGVIIDDGEIDD